MNKSKSKTKIFKFNKMRMVRIKNLKSNRSKFKSKIILKNFKLKLQTIRKQLNYNKTLMKQKSTIYS